MPGDPKNDPSALPIQPPPIASEERSYTENLDSLPTGITTEALKSCNINFDVNLKTLVLKGKMSLKSRNSLQDATEDQNFLQAIENLYRKSNVVAPDDLKLKEVTDEYFVTEEMKKMPDRVMIWLLGWLILCGAVSIIALIEIWPNKHAAIEDLPQKIDSALVSQSKHIDSLFRNAQAAQPANERKMSSSPDSLKSSSAKLPSDVPKAPDAKNANSGTSKSNNGEEQANVWDEKKFLIVALLGGILGGASRGISSILVYRSNRRLFYPWLWNYGGQPILGGMLAVISLAILHAGLLGASGLSLFNPFGVLALSSMVGLFIDEFTNKLSEVFKTLFATKSSPTSDGAVNPKAKSG